MSHSVRAVTYTGIADLRSISKKEWEAINVTDQESVEWSVVNDKTVPGAKFVDGAIAYLRSDPEFLLDMEKSSA